MSDRRWDEEREGLLGFHPRDWDRRESQLISPFLLFVHPTWPFLVSNQPFHAILTVLIFVKIWGARVRRKSLNYLIIYANLHEITRMQLQIMNNFCVNRMLRRIVDIDYHLIDCPPSCSPVRRTTSWRRRWCCGCRRVRRAVEWWTSEDHLRDRYGRRGEFGGADWWFNSIQAG